MTDASPGAPDRTALLVIGAGPYGVAVAAYARARGIATVVSGQPMALWRAHMPAGMFLRSSTDWHLDAEDVHTFAAFVEDRDLAARDIDPVPIAVFLDYTDWFIERTGVAIDEDLVTRLVRRDDGFEATFASGRRLVADRVVAASGIARFQRLPAWAGEVPAHLRHHTCDFVDFAAVRDARLLIVGGRQSAYEWAALAVDHGAARIDVVHRHPMPRFAPVSWAFVNPYIEQTLQTRGWWQGLPAERQQAITREFWAAGRLTLEPWLTPRLPERRVVRRPECEVTAVTATTARDVTVRLSDGDTLTVDQVVFATGYASDLTRVPYLADMSGDIDQVDGHPRLDGGSQSSVPGLYFAGFAATRDFGPFFGFTKGCPAAASIIVDDLLRLDHAARGARRGLPGTHGAGLASGAGRGCR
jgi:cation diffusion facilitator CzcD-associated flavoprotein CzcO